MKKLIIIALLVAILAAAGLFLSLPNQVATDPEPTPNPEPPLGQVEPAPLNPLSIYAARQKEYDGRDLALGLVLDDNSAYTRYFATYKSGALTISGIMNVPKGGGPFPVIITNHGYIDPDVYTNGRGLKREQ